MKKLILTISALLLMMNFSYAQDCLDVKFKIRGYFYAGTSQLDSLAPGGFYEDKNSPKTMDSKISKLVNQEEFKIVVLENVESEFNKKITGFKVFVINNTDSIKQLPAQDSRLYLKRQVFYKGKWQDIEYLPSSWCGNSYHSVYIKSNEYWDFTAPCLKGDIEAKFRFELYVNDDLTLYSNVFSGSFNKSQLTKEQGHKTNGLMDPYNN